MSEKEVNQIKYAVLFSMIMDLYEDGSFDKDKAERINSQIASQLGCREMTIE